MRQSGSMTVEAALLFPMIFGICILFIQIALYFTAVEYVKAVCNQGLLQWSSLEDEKQVHLYIEDRIGQFGLLKEDIQTLTSISDYLMFSKKEISVSGTYELLFPMDITVSSAGYQEQPVDFCNMTDLIWECAGRINAVKEFIRQWND